LAGSALTAVATVATRHKALAGRDAAKHLQEHVQALTESGLLIGARQRFCLLTGGSQEPSPWHVLDIEIQPLSIAQLVDEAGAAVWPPASAS
jgi:hypothetical protein